MTSSKFSRSSPPADKRPPNPTEGRLRRPAQTKGRADRSRSSGHRRRHWFWPVALLAAVAVFVGLYLTYRSSSDAVTAGGGSDYQVGSPGVGAPAPDFALTSTQDQLVSVSSYQGKSVLLYFHEGLGCQPCSDQIRDLEKDDAALAAAGVDQLLTITSGPQDLIAQKMADDDLSAVALTDTDLAVSRQYNANRYGMMGDDRDGHTFILVGPDGTIQWRADYGGAPRYTMYVPVPQLLADLLAARQRK